MMDGGAGDEAGALAADGEEWDWKSRLAPLEEEEDAAAAKRSLEDRDEDDGAWRDEDDYGNPTAEKKVKLSKEKSELYAHHSERQRRADEKAAVKKVADVALLESPPLESESVALTLLDGSRYFAEVAATDAGRETANPFANGGLLATSVGALRAELLSASSEGEAAPMDVDGAAAPEEEAEATDARRRFDGRLWVDKYAPSAFHHLLSDERANREVLRALKDWDPFVFKRPAPPPPRQPAYQSFGGGSGGRGGGGGGAKGFDRGPDRSSSGGRRLDAPRRLNAKRGEYKDRPRSANCVTVAMGRGGGGGRGGGQGGRGRGGQGGFKGGKGRGSGGGKGAAAFGGEAPKTIGDDKRPLVRVILLTGEPGTGKTTLAHVLAKAAGYRVREINASDERSAEALEAAVRTAAQNRTLRTRRDVEDAAQAKERRRSSAGPETLMNTNDKESGLCGKPTLLVLDELDGADGKAAINAIVAMAKAPLAKRDKAAKRRSSKFFGLKDGDSSDDDDDKGAPSASSPTKKRGGAPKAKGPPPLTRPIICVCNDAFSPAMRALREVSLVFHFRKVPHPQRLAARLKHVCRLEDVDVSPAAVSALADASLGDVRSAIHALQFAAQGALLDSNKKGGERSAAALAARVSGAVYDAVNRGFKDKGGDDFELWTRLFKRSNTKRKVVGADGGRKKAVDGISDTTEAASVLAAVASSDSSRVVAGVHENYVHVPLHDSSLERTVALLDDLSVADAMVGDAVHRGHYELLQYAGAAAGLAAFSRYRVDHVPRMQAPSRHAAVQRDRDRVRMDFHAVDDARVAHREPGRDPAPGQRRLGADVCATDVASSLRRVVLGAKVRAVNPDLLRDHERTALDRTVRVLAANGLTFERHRGQDLLDGKIPVPTWHLRPDVSAPSRFGDAPEEPAPPFLKQMLARQVMLHKVKAKEALANQDHPDRANANADAAPDPTRRRPDAAAKGGADAPARLGKGADDTAILLANAAKAHDATAKPAFSFANWGTKRARPPSALAKETTAATKENAAADAPTPMALDAAPNADKPKPPAVTYKFQKGFTNAVRRPVTLADLLA